MDKLFIIIPAYNEEENIKDVIKDWYPIIEKIGNDSKLIIINDGSKDHTLKIIEEEGKSRPNLIPLNKENSGHGGTILYGYQYGIKEKADYIFQTDSDGQTLPEEFWDFWKAREKYDMVIGNRNKREDGISRIIVSRVLKLFLGLIFGVSVVDANTPYRLMKVDTLKVYIDIIPDDYNLTNVLVTVIFHKKEKEVKYLPITFRQRQGGVNSINFPKIMKIGLHAINDFHKIKKKL